MNSNQPSRAQIYLSFALVYLFWGSTYLAIAIAVKHIPAALTTGLRFIIAGPLMLAWCALTKRSIGITRRDFWKLLAISLLLLTGGNMVLVWTEGFIPSGLASLFVAIVPVYMAFIDGIVLRGDRLNGRGWIGILLGTLGLVLLLWPKLVNTTSLGHKQLIACLVVMCAAFSWACGSILSKKSTISVGAFVAAGWEMTFAGVANLLLAGILGDFRVVVWERTSLLAVLYLVVFGSWVGFTAYMWLLDHVPTSKVATYAYVNPVVAVLLGFLILHEQLDRFTLMGMFVIIAAVILVTSAKLKAREPEVQPVLTVCSEA